MNFLGGTSQGAYTLNAFWCRLTQTRSNKSRLGAVALRRDLGVANESEDSSAKGAELSPAAKQ